MCYYLLVLYFYALGTTAINGPLGHQPAATHHCPQNAESYLEKYLLPMDCLRRKSQKELLRDIVQTVKASAHYIIAQRDDLHSEDRLALLLRTTLKSPLLHRPSQALWDLQLVALKEAAAICLDAFLNNQSRLFASLKLKVLLKLSPFLDFAQETLFHLYTTYRLSDPRRTQPQLIEYLLSLVVCGHPVCNQQVHIVNTHFSRKHLVDICHGLDSPVCNLAKCRIPKGLKPEIVTDSTRVLLTREISPHKLRTADPDSQISFRIMRLPNGLKVLILHDPNSTHVYILGTS